MTTHRVKSWKPFFDAIRKGDKLHDLRVNDRDYKVGDMLVLECYEPFTGNYTGETHVVEVSFITSNQFPCAFSSAVLPKDYVILSLRRKAS